MSRPDPPEPIVVIGIPRSGTSMVSGIFAAHGVWVGDCKPPTKINPKGFFENTGIRAMIKQRWGLGQTQAMNLAAPQDGWRDDVLSEIDRQGYNGGPWLVKHAAVAWPIWHEFSPQFICVRRRNVHEAFQAIFPTTRARRVIQYSNDQMDHVRDQYGGVDVQSDDVVAGDNSSLERAFSACDLPFDSAIAERFVDHSLWHY